MPSSVELSMTVIVVPKPRGVIDPERPVNALLKAQVEHLQEAERVLPLKYHSEIYIRAIRTEGEAAEYIQQVTESIHKAHADAAAKRARRLARRKDVIEIAAVADEGAGRKAQARAGAKKRAVGKKAGGKKKKS
jgi:hypothetical protein